MAACSCGAYLASRPAACLTCGSPAGATLNDDALWWARFHGARAARLARVERVEELSLPSGEPRPRWPAQNVREAARGVFFAGLCLALSGAMLSTAVEGQPLDVILLLTLIGSTGAVLC